MLCGDPQFLALRHGEQAKPERPANVGEEASDQPTSLSKLAMTFDIHTSPEPSTDLVPYVRMILNVYSRHGIDPGAALRQAGIDAGIMDAQVPAAPVSRAQTVALSNHAMRELDDETLGWSSRPMPWGGFSMLARASLTAPNLRVALKRWVRHQNLLLPDITMGLQEADGAAILTFEEVRTTWESAFVREFALTSLVRCIWGYASWLIDSAVPLIDVRFPLSEPISPRAAALLKGYARTGAEGPTTCRFDNRYLDLPNRRNEADMQAMLSSGEAILIVSVPYRPDRRLVQRIRSLLKENPARIEWTAEDIAQTLNVSVRTLHRHLTDEGISLQALKDDARKTRAIHLLLHTDLPLKRIAADVGFAHERSLNRAFREWTGELPSGFRHRSVQGTSMGKGTPR
jgi:AraC-like DNA-binding protein